MEFANTNRPVWGKSFVVDGGGGDGFIHLAQRDRKNFALESTITFFGITGLESLGLPNEAMQQLRNTGPSQCPVTDLASIPFPMRWWINTYGEHTLAAIIHDRFIGGELPEGVEERHIDRYFRFMLKDSGVRIGKRWIIWAAVAMRTRFMTKTWPRISVIIWSILAVAGMIGLALSVLNLNALGILLFGLVAPIMGSGLWSKQFGAGLIASLFVAPFLLLPGAIAATLLLPFWLLETLASKILTDDRAGDGQFF